MAAHSPEEQLLLEIINRARMDPAAEFARVNYTRATPGSPVPVLAGNDELSAAAGGHTHWMVENESLSHSEPGNDTFGRIVAAGYGAADTFVADEHLSVTADSNSIDPAKIYGNHAALFSSMRATIFSTAFREIGLGIETGQFTFANSSTPIEATYFDRTYAAHNSNSLIFVTGVVYNDTITNDDFFTVGEQVAARNVTESGGLAGVTGPGGGYEIGFAAAGTKIVTFDLPGGIVSVTLKLGTDNVKVDIVNGTELWTNTDILGTTGPINEFHALGTKKLHFLGGAGPQKIYGTPDADTMNGGAGADRLFGLGGTDLYVVDAGDVVDETGGGNAIDTVTSSVTFSLANTLGAVEHLTLTGASAIAGTGNALNNTIVGNAAANTLKGGSGNDVLNGGAGNDRMFGQAGADTYIVAQASDIVDETGGNTAVDTVSSSVTFSLAARAIGAVENIVLTGSSSIGGTGSNFNNVITGNTGSNVLAGGIGNDTLRGQNGSDTLTGGHGIDVLTGGAQSDFFVFNAPLNLANRDVITDFANAAGNNDTFRLENAVMTKLGAAGALKSAFFFAGAAAHDADDHLIYNRTSGALSYDSNGNLAGGVTLLATLSTKPLLTVADFVVI
jgi:Ca2+-binding RTX toxin-like protein